MKANNILTLLHEINPKFIIGTITNYDPLYTHKNVIFFDINNSIIWVNGQRANNIDKNALSTILQDVLWYENSNPENDRGIINTIYYIFYNNLNQYKNNYNDMAAANSYYNAVYDFIIRSIDTITSDDLDEICK